MTKIVCLRQADDAEAEIVGFVVGVEAVAEGKTAVGRDFVPTASSVNMLCTVRRPFGVGDGIATEVFTPKITAPLPHVAGHIVDA